MEEFRIGNDLGIEWFIKHNNNPYNLEGKDLSVFLTNYNHKYEISNFTVVGNKISFTFNGKDQESIGEYFLTLIENDGKLGMRSLDSCPAFILIPNSCKLKEGGCLNPNIEINSIRLEGSLSGGSRGLSAYEVAIKNGFVGTEQEWLLSLKGEKGDAFKYDDFTEEQLKGLKGEKGDKGRGIKSITGNRDGSWRITYSDNTYDNISNEAYLLLSKRVSEKAEYKWVERYFQAKGNYITDKELLDGLATKQPIGDYALKSDTINMVVDGETLIITQNK